MALEPVSTQITINYTGADLIPEVAITNNETTTYQSSYTIRGTCNSTTSYLKLYINGSTKPIILLPQNNTWEYAIPYLLKGSNTIEVEAINILTGFSVQDSHTVTYDLPTATEIRYATPYLKTDTGWKQINPRIKVGNKLLPIRCKVGLMSATLPLTGVQMTSSVGSLGLMATDNTLSLSGVQMTSSVGSLTFHNLYTMNLTGVQMTSSVGSMAFSAPVDVSLANNDVTEGWTVSKDSSAEVVKKALGGYYFSADDYPNRTHAMLKRTMSSDSYTLSLTSSWQLTSSSSVGVFSIWTNTATIPNTISNANASYLKFMCYQSGGNWYVISYNSSNSATYMQGVNLWGGFAALSSANTAQNMSIIRSGDSYSITFGNITATYSGLPSSKQTSNDILVLGDPITDISWGAFYDSSKRIYNISIT